MIITPKLIERTAIYKETEAYQKRVMNILMDYIQRTGRLENPKFDTENNTLIFSPSEIYRKQLENIQKFCEAFDIIQIIMPPGTLQIHSKFTYDICYMWKRKYNNDGGAFLLEKFVRQIDDISMKRLDYTSIEKLLGKRIIISK